MSKQYEVSRHLEAIDGFNCAVENVIKERSQESIDLLEKTLNNLQEFK
tara:strand:- start:282 stop:425 length:144 start_codon:yes stop_codon:yes gene_type:complete